MTIASFLSRRRRALLIGTATVLLHVLAIDFVGARIGRSPLHVPAPADDPLTIVALLHAPAPVAAPAAPPQPKPAPKPAQKPAQVRPRPAPKAVPPPPAPLPEATAGVDAGTVDGAEAPADPAAAPVQASAAEMAPAVELAASGTPPEPPVAQAAPAEPVKPALKASLPPSAELNFDVARTDRDGGTWSGVSSIAWKQAGGAYTLSMEASVSVLVARVNLVLLTSEGTLGPGGIIPRTTTEKRRGKSQTATHFGGPDGKITFSASERSYPMVAGAQDKASFLMQLAAIGRADSAQFASGVELFVGEEKDANPFGFVLVGQEDIDTRMGRMATWHLARPPRPGAYNSRLDIWLAPAHNWYPVQIRNTESNGSVTTQTIRKIHLTD
ncbi:DUF3108 domain-containing protein [Massilia atriviolacea]|uniref:DUF3108 domain-containing protein n=1 Tax=Massilia atriviolacea TaxID=2495579 RepID=A0A430HHG2_9BURK|nr:DUF3108 domain-containing protein [Massilia atriviolacea]RSZ56942.1 DUF3108 domain-containing protein [Massilia atriviolacea]